MSVSPGGDVFFCGLFFCLGLGMRTYSGVYSGGSFEAKKKVDALPYTYNTWDTGTHSFSEQLWKAEVCGLMPLIFGLCFI